MIALSGWRRGEALGLHWRDLDLDRRTVILTETKTGRSLRPLARGVCDQLRAMPRFGDGLGLVFPSSRGDGGMEGYFKYWLRVAKLSGLPADVTPHILRHSFASIASDLGYSEPTVAALVGHQGRSMTARYTHAADAVLLAAADAVARRIAELMGEAPASATVVELRGMA
jgi:integrase